jgi:hypothetical protein
LQRRLGIVKYLTVIADTQWAFFPALASDIVPVRACLLCPVVKCSHRPRCRGVVGSRLPCFALAVQANCDQSGRIRTTFVLYLPAVCSVPREELSYQRYKSKETAYVLFRRTLTRMFYHAGGLLPGCIHTKHCRSGICHIHAPHHTTDISIISIAQE